MNKEKNMDKIMENIGLNLYKTLNVVAIRLHRSSTFKPVYVASWAEWEEYFGKTFQNKSELRAEVLKWSEAKRVEFTMQYDRRNVNTISQTLKRRREEKAKVINQA